MQLSRENHPVGTEFLGFRARYVQIEDRLRRDDDRPCAVGWDCDSSAPPTGRRSDDGDLQAIRVLEYTPSGDFVRIADLHQVYQRREVSVPEVSAPWSAEHMSHYGYWRRTEIFEVLERLDARNAP